MRSEQTKIINTVIGRDTLGRYTLNMDEPLFTENRSKFSEKFGTDSKKGVPKALAIAQCGDLSSFQEAVREGDLEEIVDNGQKFYVWRELVIGSKYGTRTEHSISSKKKIDSKTYHLISASLDKLEWNFAVS